MAIAAAAIHRIHRYQDDKPATLLLQEQHAEVSADLEGLLTQLKKLFNAKPGKQYGKFHRDMGQCPLQGWLKEVVEGKLALYKASILWMEHLKLSLNEEMLEIDGHCIFILDQREEQLQFYLFFMEPETVTRFNDQMELELTEALNLSKLDFAIHINILEWMNTDPDKMASYITLVRGRSTAKTGEVLSKAAGFENSIDTNQETESLLQALERYSLKEDTALASQYRQKAYDFCKDQQALGDTVEIEMLSKIMDEEQPDKFQQFVIHENEINLDKPLHPDARKLKRLVRFTGKGKGLSLSFSSDLIQTSVHYDTKKETLTLLDIPKSLKQQLSQHFTDEEAGE
jgi:nucleoid-associated protein